MKNDEDNCLQESPCLYANALDEILIQINIDPNFSRWEAECILNTEKKKKKHLPLWKYHCFHLPNRTVLNAFGTGLIFSKLKVCYSNGHIFLPESILLDDVNCDYFSVGVRKEASLGVKNKKKKQQ